MNLLGAAMDNMTDLDAFEVKDQITTMMVRMASTIHRCEDDFSHSQLEKMASLVCEFHSDEHLSGEEAENLFCKVYQKVWKHEMKTTDDPQDWNGDIDWRKFWTPKKVVIRIATACASQDATNTKAWYTYAADHFQ